MHEESQGSKSEIPNPHKDIRGSTRKRKGCPSSLSPSGCTIWEQALDRSHRTRQARRAPTSPQSASQVCPASAAHYPKGGINVGIRAHTCACDLRLLTTTSRSEAGKRMQQQTEEAARRPFVLHTDMPSSQDRTRTRLGNQMHTLAGPGPDPVVKSVRLDDKSTAKGVAQPWAREKEAKVRAGVWMWWTDWSCSEDGSVWAAAVCKHGIEWRTRCSHLGTGLLEGFDPELWAIGLALGETVKGWGRLQEHGVKTAADFSDSQATIRCMAHRDLGPGQQLARRPDRTVLALLTEGIATAMDWVLGHSGVPGNTEADHQSNLARDTGRIMAMERPCTSALNRARWIAEGRSGATAEWEADKCSKDFSYRPKHMTGTKRPVLNTSVTSLATWFYRLKCGHAPTGVYLKRFGHLQDDNGWWCSSGGRSAAQTREHLFRHCSR